MQNLGKSAMRVAKNSIKGYSDVQTKVRDATSNDPWGPSGTQMSEIAALTFNANDFVEIIEMLDKRLNDKGKNWRHVFKSLTLLDYCLHAGSENVVQYFRENIYIVKTLKEFQFIDEFGKDQGANVRQKAKDITNLLLDESRMKHQRANRKDMRDRMAGERPRSAESNRRTEPDRRGARSVPSGDRDLEAAIAASKASAEEEARRNGRGGGGDSELEEAMRLSREEDERRKRELAASSGGGLFDDQQQQSNNSNNLIDIDAPVQQPMQTGWASYNPYAAQQQAQMEEQMRQAQMMELQRQQAEQQQYQYAAQQQALQQQYAQQQAQEQYMQQQRAQYEAQLAYQQQQQQQQQPIQPQPTAFGTHNPFAQFASTPKPASPPPALPQSTSYTGFQQQQQPPEPAPAPARAPRDDGKHAGLAKMLAGGRDDGLDSFGNVGATRVPMYTQRTGGNLVAQPTGLARANPFDRQVPRQQQQQQQPQQQQNNDTPFFTI